MERPKIIYLQPEKYCSFTHDKMLGKGVVAIVENPKYVVFEDYIMYVENDDDTLEVGKEVLLTGSLAKRVFLEYKAEYDAYIQFKKDEKEQREKNRLIDKRKASDEFWLTYKFPFKYSLEIKEVLSGLSQNSLCNGANNATVLHLYLHEDFKDKKLIRKKDSFLCSQTKKYGNWSGNLGDYGNEFDIWDIKNVVTCKQCLKLINRFKTKI